MSRFDGTSFEGTNLTFCDVAADDNPAVVASPSLLTAKEGGTLTIEEKVLLANDIETQNATLRITGVSDAVNGTVSVKGPIITYVHDGSETTTGGFNYVASDTVHFFISNVTVSVTPVNDPPVTVGDSRAVDEGGVLLIEKATLLINDTDAEKDSLRVVGIGDADNGTVQLNGATITYEHDGSETTTDSFLYAVSDGTDTGTAMVTIEVNPVNDPPVAVADTATVDEGGTLSVKASALLANDTDAEDDKLSITALGDVVNGSVVLAGTTIIYEHDDSETITGSFSYTIFDGTATDTATDTATVTLTVIAVNDPPVAVADTATVGEGGTLSVKASALLANDTDAEDDKLSITAVGDVVNGSVVLAGTTIIYEHDDSETTTGSFSYVVTDGAYTNTATVAVMVTPIDDAPVRASEQTVVSTVTPTVEATVSPTSGSAAVADSPATTPPVPPTAAGGTNSWLVLIFVAGAVVIVAVGVVLVLRQRNRMY